MTQIQAKQALEVELLLHDFHYFLALLKASIGDNNQSHEHYLAWLKQQPYPILQEVTELCHHLSTASTLDNVTQLLLTLQQSSVTDLEPMQAFLLENEWAVSFFRRHIDSLTRLGQSYEQRHAPAAHPLGIYYGQMMSRAVKPLKPLVQAEPELQAQSPTKRASCNIL